MTAARAYKAPCMATANPATRLTGTENWAMLAHAGYGGRNPMDDSGNPRVPPADAFRIRPTNILEGAMIRTRQWLRRGVANIVVVPALGLAAGLVATSAEARVVKF